MEPVTCQAFATYLNAGLRGSRFMGECEVGAAGGEVWVTGHRMPLWLTRIRASAYVVFVPWIFLAFGAMAAVASPEPEMFWLVIPAAVGFLYVAFGIGVGDLWAQHRAPVETLCWPASDATPLKQKHDRTASATGVLDTTMLRLVQGKSVAELRVPVGARGAKRLLALRADAASRDRLMWVLNGGYQEAALTSASS